MTELRLKTSYDPNAIPAQAAFRSSAATKTCSKCGIEKPLDEFHRQKAGKHGRRADCALCQSVYNAAWKAANKERCAEVNHLNYLANLDERRAKSRAWNRANPDSCERAVREHRLRYPERVAAQKRAWRLANPEKVRQHKRDEYARDREKIIARVRKWALENPDLRRAQSQKRIALKKSAAGAGYTTARHIADRWALYGNRCYYCGADAESSDHRIPLALGGSHWPSNLVPCCKSCNSSKNARTEKQFREVMSTLPP